MSIERYLRLQGFLAELPGLRTAAELAAATIAVSAPMGLPVVMAGVLSSRGDRDEGEFMFGNWPESWKDFYVREMRDYDPVVQEARRRVWPFSWSELAASGDDAAAAMRRILPLVSRFGWTDGVAVPIHGPAGYLGLVSFAGGPLTFGAEERLLVQALARAAHEHATGLIASRNSGKAVPRLSKRELQVMGWVARGRTDAQIAKVLKLSATTVHTYVQQAMRKLGVRSRSQAVNELMLHSLLTPARRPGRDAPAG